MNIKNNNKYEGRVKHRRGTMMVEITISLAALAILTSGVYLSMRTFKGINYYHHAQQQCMAAGQAQLDSLLSYGEPLTDQQIKELWPKIKITIEKSPGTSQWQGLQHISVTAKCTTSMGKDVAVTQSRYYPKTTNQAQTPEQDVSPPQINTTDNTL
ncbi:MAG: hypothetical protein K9M57_04055 [Phycisphaerae bacterium]|nr:hypothetical protein [Phycisphaerae bacterium]